MNYRHLFHAGNFADILKHALLLEWLAELTRDPAPLAVFDTHAGAGRYDLQDPRALKAGEAEAGVGRLLAATTPPPALARLKAAVKAGSGAEERWYPGSPLLALCALRPGDAWCGCELREEEGLALRAALPADAAPAVEVRVADGYAAAAAPSRPGMRRLVLIDPPFERADEADRIVETLASGLRAPDPLFAVWLPLKDLDGFDRLLGRVEALRPPASLAVQARLRPLSDPLRMNGCAMLLIGDRSLEAAAAETAVWVAANLGEAGAEGRVERFGG